MLLLQENNWRKSCTHLIDPRRRSNTPDWHTLTPPTEFLLRSYPILPFVLPVLLWKHTAALASDSFISCFCVFLSPFSLGCPTLESPVSHHHSLSCVFPVKFSSFLCQLIFVPQRQTFQQSSDVSSCFLGFCLGFFACFADFYLRFTRWIVCLCGLTVMHRASFCR